MKIKNIRNICVIKNFNFLRVTVLISPCVRYHTNAKLHSCVTWRGLVQKNCQKIENVLDVCYYVIENVKLLTKHANFLRKFGNFGSQESYIMKNSGARLKNNVLKALWNWNFDERFFTRDTYNLLTVICRR